jgi:hypothetical protein
MKNAINSQGVVYIWNRKTPIKTMRKGELIA